MHNRCSAKNTTSKDRRNVTLLVGGGAFYSKSPPPSPPNNISPPKRQVGGGEGVLNIKHDMIGLGIQNLSSFFVFTVLFMFLRP